jgi:hypothetical protein
MRVPARGMFFAWPATVASTKIAFAILLFGCIFGLVGLKTRLSLTAAALSSFYLLGVAQMTGNIQHNHHHVWFLALLAASPCGDALSLDARDRGGDKTEPSVEYGVPIFFARALIAAIFFFPGYWKLRESGLAWIFSDNLRNQMWWKWAQYDWVPSIRIDHSPGAMRAMALFAVLFELTFPLFAFVRRTRKYAVIAALVFHASIEAMMRIPFSSLWLCYVVFVDWGPPLARSPTPLRPEWSVGAALLAGNVLFGAMGWMNGWPFACYPTFQWRAGLTMPGLIVEDANGNVIAGRPRTQSEWGVQWSLLGLRDRPLETTRLRAAYPKGARFFRVAWSVNPDDRGKPPVRSERVW